MMKTYMPKESTIERKWYVVDANGMVLGRLASQVASILRGKHKPCYTPHVDTGDYVIVINTDKMILTGKKLTQKQYFRYSGYPGGDTLTQAKEMMEKKSNIVLEKAVKGMLPHNTLGADMFRKLKAYKGSEHPHQAQQPKEIKIKGDVLRYWLKKIKLLKKLQQKRKQ